MMKKSNLPKKLLGIHVDDITLSEFLTTIKKTVSTGQKKIFANVNVNAINIAYEQGWYRDFFNQCDIVFCDGYGVKLAAALCGFTIRERITSADMMWRLAEFSEKKEITLFFLGSKPGVAEKAAAQLQARNPRLQILGCYHGFFEKSPASDENRTVISMINACKPDVLILGMGMPMQERWLVDNWDGINAHVALTGGAVFDYVSGELKRAPRWMTDHGLEWLGRLFIEPRRLWKRYIIGNPLFFWRVFIHEILRKPLPK